MGYAWKLVVTDFVTIYFTLRDIKGAGNIAIGK